jgi:hypothetical protein
MATGASHQKGTATYSCVFNARKDARLLKWQAEGLIIRLDHMGLAEANLNRWRKISYAGNAHSYAFHDKIGHTLTLNALNERNHHER